MIGQACTPGMMCQGGASCLSGVCQCPVGFTNINGQCSQGGNVGVDATVCPGNMRPFTDANVPRTCTGNSFLCPSGIDCVWSPIRRQYYCCQRFASTSRQSEADKNKQSQPMQHQPVVVKGEQGCPVGRPLMYEYGAAPTPIICFLDDQQQQRTCPQPYTCLPATAPYSEKLKETEGQCCSTITATKSSNTTSTNKQMEVISFGPVAISRQPVTCAAHQVQVTRKYPDGTERVGCESACPYNQVLRNGICVDYTLRLLDSPIEEFS